MSRGSLINTEPFTQGDPIRCVVNLRITHNRASVPTLEALTFQNPKSTMEGVRALPSVRECVLLQTCNRVEIYAVVTNRKNVNSELEITEYWKKKLDFDSNRFHSALEVSFGSEALLHLLRLASGLESMIIGEDQILGQLQKTFEEAKRYGTIGPILQRVFERAIRTGKAARLRTQINKGAVSIGSIAVNLLEEYIGDLKNKKILLIGAGQLAALVGKALATRKTATIFVANRTYERATWLAKILDAQAVRFDRLEEFLAFSDAAIVATAAPHYVLTHDMVLEVLENRRKNRLLIIDLSQPRNIEENVANLPNVELRNIDNLREIAQVNLQLRLEEIRKVEAILHDELTKLVNALKQEQVEPIISALYGKTEKIKCKEVEKALKMMKNAGNPGRFQMEKCGRCTKIVEDLSRELIEKTLVDLIVNLRKAAVNNDFSKILVAQELFDIESEKRE